MIAASFGIALLLPLEPQATTQQPAPLPGEVREWLERDQAQRWATLVDTGRQLFNEGSCARCHGDNGVGGNFGPDLTDDQWVQSEGDLDGIQETILWGVRRRDFGDPPRRFEMNPAGGMQLEWDEIRALAAYVWSLGDGRTQARR